jgi:tRNA U38,U39,U40 pseudouridine synthase TruA
VGKETRYITKLFKTSDIRIAFTTRDNLRHLLNNNHNHTARNPYNNSGVYQLTCSECDKRYIRQSDRPFHIRFKKHAREYTYATNKSNYAKHLLENNHTLQPMEKCMSVLYSTGKGPLLNTLEDFYIYRETLKDNQLNDKNTVAPNSTFDTILRHCDSNIPRFRTY